MENNVQTSKIGVRDLVNVAIFTVIYFVIFSVCAMTGVVPVMAPLTHDGEGHMLNTNADTIAGETAKALSGQFDVTLVYCFEKKGVLRDENDDESVTPQITPEEFKQYVAEGVIQGGMIPKLENSFEALNAGVMEVVITLASAINSAGGTRIIK